MSEEKPWLKGLRENWYVSHFNLMSGNLPKFPDRIYVHDTTLRDGEQQPGIIFSSEDKIRIAKALDEVGVDFIEPGLPVVSQDDQEATKEIANMGLKAKIVPFSRCIKGDIELAYKLGCDGITAELPTSPHLIEYGYGWSVDRAINSAVESTKYAKELGLYVTFFCIDATRSSIEFLVKMLSATQEYADAFCIADSFGVSTPEGYAYLIKTIKERIDKPLQVHTHNMFGLGAANAIAGISAGAEVAHVTVNGLGEGAGNAPLEDFLVSLRMLYDKELPQIQFNKIYPLAKLVEELSGVNIAPQKAIIGENPPATLESGIPIAWINKLEPIGRILEAIPYLPEFVGHPGLQVVLGKGSGYWSIVIKMRELGLEIPEESVVRDVMNEVKETGIAQHRALNDDDFKAILKKKGLLS